MTMFSIRGLEGLPDAWMCTDVIFNDRYAYVKDIIHIDNKKRNCRICVVEV